MEKIKMPVGIDDFADFHQMGYYYIDKTGMIKELLESPGKVNLFTRPRRFGKSLIISMLKYFFEIGTDKSLFDGLAISKEKELCEKYMGQFPVIAITLKQVTGETMSEARNQLWESVIEAEDRIAYIIEVKYSKKEEELPADAQEGLDQIHRMRYDQYFSMRFPKRIRHFGIAFCKKQCKVVAE